MRESIQSIRLERNLEPPKWEQAWSLLSRRADGSRRAVSRAVEDAILELKGLEEKKKGSEVGVLFSQLVRLEGDLCALEERETNARHSSNDKSLEIQTLWLSYLRSPPSWFRLNALRAGIAAGPVLRVLMAREIARSLPLFLDEVRSHEGSYPAGALSGLFILARSHARLFGKDQCKSFFEHGAHAVKAGHLSALTYATTLRTFILRSETSIHTALELAEYAKRTYADLGRPPVESVFKDIGKEIVEKQAGSLPPLVRRNLLVAHPAVLLGAAERLIRDGTPGDWPEMGEAYSDSMNAILSAMERVHKTTAEAVLPAIQEAVLDCVCQAGSDYGRALYEASVKVLWRGSWSDERNGNALWRTLPLGYDSSRGGPSYLLFKGTLAYRDSFAALCGEVAPKIGLALFDDGLKALGALVRGVLEERIEYGESRVSSEVCCRALELLSLLPPSEIRRTERCLSTLMGQPTRFLGGFGRWLLPWRGRPDSDSHVVRAAQDVLDGIVG